MSQNKYVGQRAKDVFRDKGEGRGMSVLVMERPGKEGFAHSAVRLHRKEEQEYLALFVQES